MYLQPDFQCWYRRHFGYSGEDGDDLGVLVDNQCHLCKKELDTKDELFDHSQAEHEEYYNVMLEIAANMTMNNSAGCWRSPSVSSAQGLAWPADEKWSILVTHDDIAKLTTTVNYN